MDFDSTNITEEQLKELFSVLGTIIPTLEETFKKQSRLIDAQIIYFESMNQMNDYYQPLKVKPKKRTPKKK